MNGVHICRPPITWLRRVAVCPVCHIRGRIVGMSQEWYDTQWTCCNCGDAWEGGELLPRPFARGWRAAAKARARQRWADAPSLNANKERT